MDELLAEKIMREHNAAEVELARGAAAYAMTNLNAGDSDSESVEFTSRGEKFRLHICVVSPDAENRLKLLTPREQQVCDLLIEGHNTKQIAAKIGRTTKTVDNHRVAVFVKMNVNSAVELRKALIA